MLIQGENLTDNGPTNRTKVELKRVSPIPKCPPQTVYQSYQSGIETVDIYSLADSLKCYQSYQSGIETVVSQSGIKKRPTYQSYQSGIETFWMSETTDSAISLPIVPKWNWNLLLSPTRISGQPATNRTKVELKLHKRNELNWFVCYYQSYQSGIETQYCEVVPVVIVGSTNRTKVELKPI